MYTFAIVLFIWGIIILFSHKCKIYKYPVKGKRAKAIGINFVVIPVCLFVLDFILYKIFDSQSGTFKALVVEPLVISTVFFIGIGIALYLAISKAIEYQDLLKAKELDP